MVSVDYVVAINRAAIHNALSWDRDVSVAWQMSIMTNTGSVTDGRFIAGSRKIYLPSHILPAMAPPKTIPPWRIRSLAPSFALFRVLTGVS